MSKTTTDQPAAAAVDIPNGKQTAGAVAVVQAARKVLTFRERCYEISFPMLKSMVGEQRAKEASGRVAAALAAG